jgi:predicted transposase/invertase (TIGR01784 family)
MERYINTDRWESIINSTFDSSEDRLTYLKLLKRDRDFQNALHIAFENGRERGLLKGKLEIARNLIQENQEDVFVQEVTGLTLEQIQALRKEMQRG